MALPAVETGVIELVKEEEAAARAAAALASVNGNAAPAAEAEVIESETVTTVTQAEETKSEPAKGAPAAATAEVVQETVEVASATADVPAKAAPSAVPAKAAPSAVAAVAQGNPDTAAFLAEQGFTDVQVNFASFPTITLNNEKFSSPEFPNFGTKFRCVIMQQGEQFLYRGEIPGDRDAEPELVYSDDGIYNNKVGEDGVKHPVSEAIEDWHKRGLKDSCTKYAILYVSMVEDDDNPHAGEVCRIQVSPASITKLGGYLTQLAWKNKKVRDVVTQISIGATIGTGRKAFNPFVFKESRIS